MKIKYFWYLCRWLLFIIAGVSINSIVGHADTNTNRGITLDCARTYYSPKIIKKYIRILSLHHANFLELHLNDNERFGIENFYLGQTAQHAIHKHGIYYNRQTKLAFLSKKQLRQIIKYGQQKHIQVIPEIDIPGHDRAILKLLGNSKKGRQMKRKMINPDGNHELKYDNPQTLQFSKKLISEYLPLIKPGNYIGIGADEVTIDTYREELKAVRYINRMNNYINQHGQKMMIWNDSVHRRVLKRYSRNILVFYWSQSGQLQDAYNRKMNLRLRATLPQIAHRGIKLVNCNFYYLYIIGRPKMYTSDSRDFWQRALINWNSNIWDNDNFKDIYHGKQNIGSALCLWGNNPQYYRASKAYDLNRDYVDIYLEH